MSKYSETEKIALLEAVKKMLDAGEDITIYETVEVPEFSIDPYLEGNVWPVEQYRRKTHILTIKTYER